ncbi:MAG: arsenate reductase, partial [Gammaproteobacteria bacterium]|nr:arsenate reductase [Gammaproteobacteria bacterium]
MEKLRILFLCTGNACRSQMAEGWAKELAGDEIKIKSAGIEAHGN